MKFSAYNRLIKSFTDRQLLTLLLVLIVNLIVRGWCNEVIALSRDEPFTAYFSQLQVSQFVPIILDTNNPPTFEVLLHYWSMFFGSDIKTLRWLPTIIMSLGAIPIYLLGKRIGGKSAAIMASILFLGSGFLMNTSHLDRAYCILITGSVYMFYLFLRLFEKVNRNDMLLWSIVAIITCYSHYFGWITVATIWFAVIAIKEFRRETFRKMAVATLILLVCYLPLILFLFHRFSVTQDELETAHYTLSAHRFTSLIGEFLNGDWVTIAFAFSGLGVGSYLLIHKMTRAGIILVGFSFLFLITSFTRHEEFTPVSQQIMLGLLFSLSAFSLYYTCVGNTSAVRKLVIYWAIVPLAIGFVLSQRMPIFVDRYFSFTIPAILFLVVILVQEMPNMPLRIGFFGLFFAVYLGCFEAAPKYYVDHRPAVEAFRDYHAKTDLSIVGPGYFDFDFAYYFDRAIFYNGANHMCDTVGAKISFDKSYVRFKEGFRRELRKHRIVISNDSSALQLDTASVHSIAFFDGNLSLAYPNNGIFTFLESRYGAPSQTTDFSGLYKIYVFAK